MLLLLASSNNDYYYYDYYCYYYYYYCYCYYQTVREDGLKSAAATFSVKLPIVMASGVVTTGGGAVTARQLTEGLSHTRGVLEAVVLPQSSDSSSSSSSSKAKTSSSGSSTRQQQQWAWQGKVQVRYESELVGLRDLIKALEGMGYR